MCMFTSWWESRRTAYASRWPSEFNPDQRHPGTALGVTQKLYTAQSSGAGARGAGTARSEEHTSELQSRLHLVCRLLLEKKKNKQKARVQYTMHSKKRGELH